MRIYLVQHGEAVDKNVDPERPLTERGQADVARVGAFLQQAGIRAQRVCHSGKTRAAQTADLLATFVMTNVAAEEKDGMAPDDDPAAMAAQIEAQGDDVVLVGHLPFMARLATRLVAGEAAEPVVAFRPGSVVCLERDDGWRIAWMLRPELLGED